MVPEMFWVDLIVSTKEWEAMRPWRFPYRMAIDGDANGFFAVKNSIEVIEDSAALILKGDPYSYISLLSSALSIVCARTSSVIEGK